jgi:endo-1,4-beta-mannosidase
MHRNSARMRWLAALPTSSTGTPLRDMPTVPTFIVGHMSGENWDPPWRDRRDLYADVRMAARQAWFAAEMVRRFGAHPAVCGRLVSNEMPIYNGY